MWEFGKFSEKSKINKKCLKEFKRSWTNYPWIRTKIKTIVTKLLQNMSIKRLLIGKIYWKYQEIFGRERRDCKNTWKLTWQSEKNKYWAIRTNLKPKFIDCRIKISNKSEINKNSIDYKRIRIIEDNDWKTKLITWIIKKWDKIEIKLWFSDW